jgi:hypothetical protein
MKPVEILIKHRNRIQQVFSEYESLQKTYVALSSDIQEIAEMSVATFEHYAAILIELNKSLNDCDELASVKQELEHVRCQLNKIQGSSLSVKQESTKQGLNISGWSIQESKGYFRAFRKMGGKMYAVYLGKTIDNAEAKIGMKEQQIIRVNRAEKKELKAKVFQDGLDIIENLNLNPD